MKQLSLFIVCMLTSCMLLKAQQDCECTRGSLQTVTDTLCKYTQPCHTGTPPIGFSVDFWLVLHIRYYPVTCTGGVTCNEIYDIILDMNIPSWLDECPPPTIAQCSYWPTNWYGTEIASQTILDLINDMVPNPVGSIGCFVFPAGCMAIKQIEWPAGAHYTLPVDSPVGDSVDVPLVMSLVMVPCGGTCCVEKIGDFGRGVEKTVILGTGGPCGPPDPNWQAPSYGPYIPTVTQISECTPVCSDRQSPLFSTGIDPTTDHTFNLSASPTLVDDFIKFTGKTTVSGVDIYDAQGKKMMHKIPENDEIHLQELSPGIYYMQVQYGKNSIKTVRIYKQ